MGDEYTVLPVFFTGVFFQALLFARTMAGAAGASTIAGLSLAVAWYATHDEPDQILMLPFLATGIFIVVFACFFREHLLPRISAAFLLHYTLLSVYALFVWRAGEPIPAWILATFAVPGGLAVYLGLSTRPPGRFLKLTAYVSFLLLLTGLIAQQFSVEDVKAILDAEGFGLSLNAYIFVSGMVFLVFASNLIFLLLMIPVSDRRALWDSVLGSADDAAREHRDVLVSKMASDRFSIGASSLLAAHALALLANYRWELVAPGLLMNAVVVATTLRPGVPEAGET